MRVAVLAAAVALIAGCGNDDDSTSETTAATETTAAAATETTAGAATETTATAETTATSAAAGGEPKDKIKVAFVYVGPTGDAGWTTKHDEGRKAMEQALGDKVETTFLESVPEGADSQRVFEDLVRKGFDLIFGTSFGYMDQMLAVAEANPQACLEHATGFKTAANMGTFFGAAEEARYLSGIAAGKATKSGKLGYVAAFPIPEVIRGINAFTLGVQSVSPAATVQVVWTSTWFGPEQEKQAAESLLDAGADVIAQHQDTPAAGEAAQKAGAKWLGYNDDMSTFAPEAWLTGPEWDWGPYYTRTAESVLSGKCPNDQYYGSMADGMVTLAPFGKSVDNDTRKLIEDARAKIIDGSLKPFTGPVKDQSGVEKIAAGVSAPLGELLGMNYFVQGVIGEIPKS